MNKISVKVVRIYISESSHLLNKVVHYLKPIVRGVSVFRAISGFGQTSDHSSALVDLSLDLPLVIEFFDTDEIIEPVLEYLTSLIKPEHIICWEASTFL